VFITLPCDRSTYFLIGDVFGCADGSTKWHSWALSNVPDSGFLFFISFISNYLWIEVTSLISKRNLQRDVLGWAVFRRNAHIESTPGGSVF